MYKHRGLKAIAILTLLFIFVPLILIMITAFNEADIISLKFTGVSLKWFTKVFKSRSLTSALKMSFSLSLKATILGIFIGILASIALVKIPGKLSNALLSMFLSSSLIPGIVMGFVLFRFLVVKLAIPMNTSLMCGHLLIILPYSIRLISAGLKECDVSIEEAARTLGCKPFKAFVIVVLPDLKGAILSAFMMGFINSFNNIPVSMYLKGPGMNTLPYAMMNYIEYNYDPTASALSVMLMLVTVAFMVIIDLLTGKKSDGRK
ncbi:MAG: ABC transporter permease [Sphaerochaetaceae bacterium]|nr:ABC transporter permease [Sphaerochaetaceae bacterium]